MELDHNKCDFLKIFYKLYQDQLKIREKKTHKSINIGRKIRTTAGRSVKQ